MTLIVVIVAVALLVLLWLWFVGRAGRESARAGVVEDRLAPGAEKLHYRVPEGQDPAVVLAALAKAGYDADAHTDQGRQIVVIACPEREGAREDIRGVIEDADASTLVDGAPVRRQVVFEDE